MTEGDFFKHLEEYVDTSLDDGCEHESLTCKITGHIRSYETNSCPIVCVFKKLWSEGKIVPPFYVPVENIEAYALGKAIGLESDLINDILFAADSSVINSTEPWKIRQQLLALCNRRENKALENTKPV